MTQHLPDRLFADAYLTSLHDAWCPRDARDDYDFYLPRIMSAGAVLDAGCGTGTLLHEVRQRGHSGRLCGLDPADGMLKRARWRDDIEWVCSDLASVTFAREFDLVVMTGHAFQAIVADDDIRHSIASVRRALVAGGCFAFETRNPSARAWERWRPDNAVVVTGPDGAPVRIATEVVVPFDGGTVSFTHTFTGNALRRELERLHLSPPGSELSAEVNEVRAWTLHMGEARFVWLAGEQQSGAIR